MPNCDKCHKLVAHRKKLKLNFMKTNNNKLKLQLGREWNRLAEHESMLCKKCHDKASQHVARRVTKIPKVRQWPESQACGWCQKAISSKKNLNLYRFAKGKESQFMALCNKCLNQCKSQARSCPGAKGTWQLLANMAIKKL